MGLWHVVGSHENLAELDLDFGVGAAWCYAVFALHGPVWTAHAIAGVAITVPAYCLWATARLQLGTSFAVRAQAKELVTRGLYAKIQNPVYVFNAIFITGILVFFGQPVWFLFFLILIPMQWMRIQKERRALEAKFGDAYRDYRKRTWF
jgi:protein-S-isoprenylcysteine O-methyltransferase Ste14